LHGKHKAAKLTTESRGYCPAQSAATKSISTIRVNRKDVATYGGGVSRKKKLLEKQKKRESERRRS
jgi:translation elongation factor EF-4